MKKRKLGRTEEKVSVWGFGGIVVKNIEQSKANKIVAEAVDRGINYFDVAPDYGNAQNQLGPALEPYRKDVVLACKTSKRTKKEAAEDLRESLKILKTDHIDIYQLHGIDDPQEIEVALGPGGAMEAFEEAKEKGLIRFIGFSCHSEQAALKLMDMYDFDTMLFPVNWVYWLKTGAGKKALKKASSRNMGIMAVKSLALRLKKESEIKEFQKCWYKPVEDLDMASLALKFTLSKNVSVALSPGEFNFFKLGLDALENIKKFNLTDEELEKLKKLAQNIDPIFDF